VCYKPSTSAGLQTPGISASKPLTNLLLLQIHVISVRGQPELVIALRIGCCAHWGNEVIS